MVSPNLIRKNQVALTLTPNTKKLFQFIYGKKQKSEVGINDDEIPKIHVSHIVSQLSFLYEKVRNAVDYDDDHLLRKNAIKRILKRHIFIEGVVMEYDSTDISIKLLTELIQAGYLPNDKIREVKIQEVADLLEKYIKLRNHYKKIHPNHLDLKEKESKERSHVLNWIIVLATTEIEENLNRDEVKMLIMTNMFEILSRVIKLPSDLPYQKDLDIQIYLSIVRTFLRLDPEMQSFIAFKYYNNWEEATTDDIHEIATNLNDINLLVEKQLTHPLTKQIDKIVRRYALFYSLLNEIIADDPNKVYENATGNTKAFLNLIKEHCEKKYAKVKSQLWRSGLRSIIYIFLTKSIFVILLEIPAIRFFGEKLNPTSLAINITFPAILLLIIIMFTKTPNKKNTEKIIEGIKEITYVENQKFQPIYLRRTTRRNYFMNSLFNLIYATAFTLSVYFLISMLTLVNFNWVSITIFLFFLAFVSFFSFRIKRDVKQYIITEEKETLFGFIFDFFYMPIVAVGKFLSNNISRINVFVFVLDFIIEAPFKVIIGIIEDWTKYLKERKEDLA
ncbi:hypothetical protein COT98_02245 [Candidatus Falkowbacteria bacterium CG10_big_fil_rev_8_21_14_0_10_39_9]|uniref:Uncharacterized protein n=1 Tax=Candidatus Falkowbacteria bacterium CG10_big_fil_rev_8_21_14_0_10_39_9 TaxID=1974566 RepID=A0A2M6WPN0_9BACT|nr:MAG: hypothetical protein COT98_02245 [Candidatus Falkowbacteria bacterium CG10_big_fil_rev_8_21_14_0_10_39_9]